MIGSKTFDGENILQIFYFFLCEKGLEKDG